jgi:hypothetical protein
MFRFVHPGPPWISDSFPMANHSAPWHPVSVSVNNWMLPHCRDIQYQFNRFGYRGNWDLEDINDAIWCLGDSQTLGLGVAEHETWSAQLSAMINQRTINMAVAGCSNDTLSRLLLSAGQNHRPRSVLVLLSAPNRREMHSDHGALTCFPKLLDHVPGIDREVFHSYVQGLTDSSGDLVNRDRNIALMQNWCSLHDIEFWAIDFDTDVKSLVEQDPAADHLHIGPTIHAAIAQWFAAHISRS